MRETWAALMSGEPEAKRTVMIAADEGNLGSVNVWRARSKQDGDDFRA
jgi:hypothetical protein